MKKLFQLLFLIAIVNIVFLTSCKQSTDPVTPDNNFATLTNYMAVNNMDLPDILSSWIIVAPTDINDVQEFANTYHIIDLREIGDYNAGHIQGAVNSTLSGILTAASGATKPILVACYTGQTAGHGVVALRLSGYSDAVVLKWGMSGWSSDLSGPWSGATGDAGVGNPNWSATNTTHADETFDTPQLSVSATGGAEILAERVITLINGGFKGVTNGDVLGTPTNYHINNYWAKEDVDHYGHIATAYRTSPLSISNITAINPLKPVATYCWTGQTSSMITAYLSVIGYNAVSLKFGTNGMIYDVLETHQYTVPAIDLPLSQD